MNQNFLTDGPWWLATLLLGIVFGVIMGVIQTNRGWREHLRRPGGPRPIPMGSDPASQRPSVQPPAVRERAVELDDAHPVAE